MSDSLLQNDPHKVDFDELTAVNPVDVRTKAMDLLARREHSRRELKQKLLKRFGDGDLIDQQLDLLAEENLQSDARYAESFLRQRINRGYGPNRIRQEMRLKGISDTEMNAAMQEESPDWRALAVATFERKFGALPAQDLKEKARRIRFMEYRGFSRDQYSGLV